MDLYHWLLLAGFIICLISVLVMLFTAVLKKGLIDPADAKGNINSSIIYSFTGAMSPAKKESAYLHLPTYAAGMIFHLGTFLGFFCLLMLFFAIKLPVTFIDLSAAFIVIAVLCGIIILIKRILKMELRQLSNPDDYISNVIVTAFQLLLAATLLFQFSNSFLFIYTTLLFLYIPVGKLRHAVYFFTSRIYLGRYFGKRGVWPVK